MSFGASTNTSQIMADDIAAVAALEQGLLDAGEAAAQQADDEVVADVRLGHLGAAAVVVLQQRDEAVGDRGRHVTVNDSMVALHERYHGRKPARAHTQMIGDDMLACMLGDVRRSCTRRAARSSTHHLGPDLELELFVFEPCVASARQNPNRWIPARHFGNTTV